jgi:uncharacterized protein YjbI with pentapeptide repeats
MPRLLVFLLFVAALPFAQTQPAAGQAAWTWKDSKGVVKARADLDRILSDHKLWVETHGAKGKRADLKAADLTRADLASEDLEDIDAEGTDFTAANLTGANLKGASLKETYFGGGTDATAGAVLRGADLSGADLDGATLNRADLTGAILIGTNLNSADFSNAILNDADLASAEKARGTASLSAGTTAGSGQLNFQCLHQGGMSQAIADNNTLLGAGKGKTDASDAFFNNAQLADACLNGVALTGANFTGASLTGAELNGADLSGPASATGDPGGADFSGADLNGAIYQPHQPTDLLLISKAVNLAGLVYQDDSQPIVSLRNGFRDGGFVQQERDVNEAYQNHRPDFAAGLPATGKRSLGQELTFWSSVAQYWMSQVLFEWTCGWGAKPGKPLWIIAIIALLCVPAYWIGMHFKLGRGGIYLVATSTPVAMDGAQQRAVRVEVHPERDAGAKDEPRPKRWTRGWWAAVGSSIWNGSGQEFGALKTALLFSLMSVFSIGFDGFDAGQWIRALMGREFDLKARGWMRTLSGLQSLLGLGLLALAILSYFGHPFE